MRDILTEQQRIKKIINGDQSATRELIEEFESVVAATVFGMLGNCPEADDVGQEVFVRFYRSLNKFRGDSSIKTYITRIAINLSLNELGRRKRKKQLFEDVASKNIFNIKDDDNRGWNDEKDLVAQAVNKLDDKFKSVIVLRLIDGYSTQETADILGLPAGTVLSRLARAQEKLKTILKPALRGDVYGSNL
jgi:RNA polymerase sigma-70 factor (ECF subfamily)